jgi:hypothetical protein
MVYDVPHRVTKHLRHRAATSVAYEFRQLLPGRYLEQGVRHFMTSFGIVVCEGGRMRFPRLDRTVTDEDVGRLIVDFGQEGKMSLGARQPKRKGE